MRKYIAKSQEKNTQTKKETNKIFFCHLIIKYPNQPQRLHIYLTLTDLHVQSIKCSKIKMQMYILDIFFPPLLEEKYAIEAKISKVTSP